MIPHFWHGVENRSRLSLDSIFRLKYLIDIGTPFSLFFLDSGKNTSGQKKSTEITEIKKTEFVYSNDTFWEGTVDIRISLSWLLDDYQ